jgi:hypothetical protein
MCRCRTPNWTWYWHLYILGVDKPVRPTWNRPTRVIRLGRVRSVDTGPTCNVSGFGRFSRVGGGWFNSTRRSPNPNRSYYLLINIILFSEFHLYINTKCRETLTLSSFFFTQPPLNSLLFLSTFLVNFFILLHFLSVVHLFRCHFDFCSSCSVFLVI